MTSAPPSDTRTKTPRPPAQIRAAWLEAMERTGEDLGYFQPLGGAHWALFSDDGPQLLVGFESLASLLAQTEDQLPGQSHLSRTQRIAAARGWSSLTLVADGPTWFRDPAVWAFFDRLVDDTFFEDFDRVVFHGAGMGGYAAAAHAVAAPGCTILAIAPQATLDPELTEWDRRFPAARRLDFTSRYGFAPDMADGCARLFLLYDPLSQIDAAHAALFRGPHVMRLRARGAGRDPADELSRLNILRPLIDAACTGTLNAHRFARLWRARRESAQVIGRIVQRAGANGRLERQIKALRAGLQLVDDPRLARALRQAEAERATRRLATAEARRTLAPAPTPAPGHARTPAPTHAPAR